MDALCITAPFTTERRDLPQPEPGPGEVLLRTAFVGCCGSDLNTFRGRNPMVSYPCIPGHEVSGTIERLGPGVTGLALGTRALVVPYANCGTCTACLADRPNCCQFNQTMGVQRAGAMTAWLSVPVGKLITSTTLDLRVLALVEPLTVGFHAVARARVQAGETVAVIGCGMIGLGAVAGAAQRGARVIAVDVDERKAEVACAVGAERFVPGGDGLAERLRAATAGAGPLVIIEAVGLPATFQAAVAAVAFAGRIAAIGYAKEATALETKYIVQKELDILGSRNALAADFHAVIAMLEAGTCPVERLITREVPLAEAGAALAQWHADPGQVTKILVQVGAA
jgi:2-desacetyl-2-hydroxyethyl bacteriochlorophyllide A dehydrogenase